MTEIDKTKSKDDKAVNDTANKTDAPKDTVDQGAAGVKKTDAGKNTDKAPNKASAPAVKAQKSGGKSKTYFLILLIILIIALGAALFYQQQQYEAIKQDLQSLTDSNVALVKKAEANATAALQATQEQNNKIISLNKLLDATNNQLQEIDKALQLVTDSGSDLLLLNDIDHLVTVAQQQLMLGGNVANAIISLEAAQAQLARANRTAFVSLQQAINGDLDRLRSVATVNLSALSNKVDELVALIGSAPLLVPDTVIANNSSASNGLESNLTDTDTTNSNDLAEDQGSDYTDLEYWNQLSKDLWEQSKSFGSALTIDLKKLFDIRKINDEAALLMSPDQAQRFRETLSQRAITAQLALLMQQTKIWHDELDKIAAAIDKRFDMSSQQARNALQLARELYDASIEVDLPKLKNSFSAIAAVRDDITAKENAAELSEQAASETN